MKRDRNLREALFGDLELLVYAGAALPGPIWSALNDFAIEVKGRAIPIAGSWGSTETGPLATAVYFDNDHAGNLGLPIPGCAVKFVPDAAKFEMRIRAPSVTPGYWGQPELTKSMFDDEGFYRIGDAGRLVDAGRIEAGILFDGRIGENFKLLSGTWVTVGTLRVAAIASCPDLISDVVIAGHNRDEVGLLVFPRLAACAALAGKPEGDALVSEEVKRTIARALAVYNKTAGGSSNRITRAILLAEPPSVDGNEITDKGYLNQRAVLERRAAMVERLYAEDPDADVILVPSRD
jgi:feruloyl-CoA synthase